MITHLNELLNFPDDKIKRIRLFMIHMDNFLNEYNIKDRKDFYLILDKNNIEYDSYDYYYFKKIINFTDTVIIEDELEEISVIIFMKYDKLIKYLSLKEFW